MHHISAVNERDTASDVAHDLQDTRKSESVVVIDDSCIGLEIISSRL